MVEPEFIYLEACNFEDFPTGGTLSFSRQMLRVFGGKMALVGITTDNTPIGKWVIKEINEVKYHFFSIGKIKNKVHKPLIPARLRTYIKLLIYNKEISSLGIKRVFTRTPQFVLGMSGKYFTNNCFCFAGLSNSIAISKYKNLRVLGNLYESVLFLNLQRKFDTILASADTISISDAQNRHKNHFKKPIHQFPTRFDPSVFFIKEDKMTIKEKLGFYKEDIILIVVGKLEEIKGWELIIDSFSEVLNLIPAVKLLFLGEGSDKGKIEKYAQKLLNDRKVSLLGRKSAHEINDFLNITDLVLVGSLREGWSNSMIEALATANKIVTTDVSGARDLVHNANNGFICYNRDAHEYSKLIIQALALPLSANQYSYELSKKYSIDTLALDLEMIWHK